MPLGFNTESLAASNPTAQSITSFPDVIHEGETAVYTVQLTDAAGGAIANTDFTAISLTLYDEQSFSIINLRNAQDVLDFPTNLGQNNVTLSVAALLTWNLQALDTPFVDPTQTKQYELHRAIFRFEFDLGLGAGPEVGVHEVRFTVRKAFSPVSFS